jgi:type I restriction enzyme R subunit
LKPHKKDTFVLDFYNSAEEIQEAFKPYYTSTILSEETSPNKLNDLVDAMDIFEVYTEEVVKDFFEKYASKVSRNVLDPIIDSAAHIFKYDLDDSKKVDFKIKVKSFLRTYSYLAKLLDFNNIYWEQLWWYLKYLLPKLIIDENEDLAQGIIESIDMDSYRPSKQTTESIVLESVPGYVTPIPVGVGGRKSDQELDTLENIISVFNQRFGDIEWKDKDKVNQFLTQQIPTDMKADSKVMDAINTSPDKQNAKISSDKKVEELMQQYLFSQTEIFKKFSTDQDFQRRYKEFVFDTIWMQNRGAQPNS